MGRRVLSGRSSWASVNPWMHTCSWLALMTLRCASRCITMHLSAGCQFLIGSDPFWDRASVRLKRDHGFFIIRLFSRSGEAAIKLLMGSLAIQQDQIVENKLGRRRKPVSLDSHVRPIRGQYAGHVITLDQSVSLDSHVRPIRGQYAGYVITLDQSVSLSSHVRPIRSQYAGHVITLDQSVSLDSHVRPGGPGPSQRWRAQSCCPIAPIQYTNIKYTNTIQ